VEAAVDVEDEPDALAMLFNSDCNSEEALPELLDDA
jgi:hypothetical protein